MSDRLANTSCQIAVAHLDLAAYHIFEIRPVKLPPHVQNPQSARPGLWPRGSPTTLRAPAPRSSAAEPGPCAARPGASVPPLRTGESRVSLCVPAATAGGSPQCKRASDPSASASDTKKCASAKRTRVKSHRCKPPVTSVRGSGTRKRGTVPSCKPPVTCCKGAGTQKRAAVTSNRTSRHSVRRSRNSARPARNSVRMRLETVQGCRLHRTRCRLHDARVR